MSDELWRRGATELASIIGDGQVSATEVLDAHLARIEAVNPSLNAIVAVLEDEARREAEDRDRARSSGEPLGPLHGVPVTIKSNIDVAATPTDQGVVPLAEAVADRDAPLVERLRQAGAVVIGRTNMPDMGLRVDTESSLHGRTRNPWDLGRTAGGSSGGDAAALATGMSPLGMGNDIGGSLRNPAHCCGIASIKPSTGRVPHATVVPPEDGSLASQLMSVNGPMARTVGDVRAALEVISGPHVRDPFAVPAPLRVDDGALRRIAVMAEPPGGSTHPGISAAVRRAGDALSDAGLEVVEVSPPDHEAAVELWAAWLITELSVMVEILEDVMGEAGAKFMRFSVDTVPTLDVAGHVTALTERRRVARQWSAFLDEHQVLLAPVWTQPPFEAGYDVADAESAASVLELIRAVCPPNLLGLPAAVVPVGLAEDLPVGVQCIAAAFREDRCLDAAEVIEERVGSLVPIDPRP